MSVYKNVKELEERIDRALERELVITKWEMGECDLSKTQIENLARDLLLKTLSDGKEQRLHKFDKEYGANLTSLYYMIRNNEDKEFEMLDIDYSEILKHDGLIGFYIYYSGDKNKFPQRAVQVKNGKIVKLIPRTRGDEEFVDTIWCGFCVKADDTCSFRENGKSVPRCLRRRR